IAEAVHAPEVARALDSIGRQTSRTALRDIVARAQASGLLGGRPAELADQFGSLLLGDLLVSLLLGVAERPAPREAEERARAAAAGFLAFHPRTGWRARGGCPGRALPLRWLQCKRRSHAIGPVRAPEPPRHRKLRPPAGAVRRHHQPRLQRQQITAHPLDERL